MATGLKYSAEVTGYVPIPAKVQIRKIVQQHKRQGKRYSESEWMTEAALEKLEREGHPIKA